MTQTQKFVMLLQETEKFELSVKLANVHIKGSPFNLTVLGSKASAKRCLISGIGTQKRRNNKACIFHFLCLR